jgi:hypothetical protein
MTAIQRLIHAAEHAGNHEDAALLLIEHRFYQVSRNHGHLSKFPPGMSGLDALTSALRAGEAYPFSSRRSIPYTNEGAAGRQYLSSFAPARDRIFVLVKTMDAYRGLGGGPYTESRSWGQRNIPPGDTPCLYCGKPSTWLGVHQCELCHAITVRLREFIQAEAGRDFILRLIGRIGLHETATILQGKLDGTDEARDITEADT